jgi:tripartite-type tricarboxylate transporter receptor subunit TctC
LKSGTLRALAVAERERLEDYPDIPTLVELGYPVVAFPIYGHSAPKGTPKNIVDKLAKGYEKILKENRKAFSDTMRKYDQIAVIMDSDEYGKRMREDYEYLRKTFIEIEKNR